MGFSSFLIVWWTGLHSSFFSRLVNERRKSQSFDTTVNFPNFSYFFLLFSNKNTLSRKICVCEFSLFSSLFSLLFFNLLCFTSTSPEQNIKAHKFPPKVSSLHFSFFSFFLSSRPSGKSLLHCDIIFPSIGPFSVQCWNFLSSLSLWLQARPRRDWFSTRIFHTKSSITCLTWAEFRRWNWI